jgi:hypothetical protein
MDPGAVPAAPVEPQGGALFDSPDILDDPNVVAQASPSADGMTSDSNLLAGAGTEDDAAGMPGEPAGMPTPAAAGVMKDDVSGIPAQMPVQ